MDNWVILFGVLFFFIAYGLGVAWLTKKADRDNEEIGLYDYKIGDYISKDFNVIYTVGKIIDNKTAFFYVDFSGFIVNMTNEELRSLGYCTVGSGDDSIGYDIYEVNEILEQYN